MPAFALDRTQKILHQITIAQTANLLPKDLAVYATSPSALKISEIYRNWARSGAPWVRSGLSEASFTPANLDESWMSSPPKGPAILLTTSGMLDAASSRSLLPKLLNDPRTDLFLVGYQDPFTPGGRIRGGASVLDFDGRDVAIRAKVANYGCFSGHGDAAAIDRWIENCDRSTNINLVHGDPESLENRQVQLMRQGWRHVLIPRLGEEIRLGGNGAH